MKKFQTAALVTILLCFLAASSFAWTISGNSIGCGSISPAGDNFVADGGSMRFTMVPDDGCRIRYLIAENMPLPPFFNDYTFTNVQANHKIEVFFESETASYPHVLYNVVSSGNFGGVVTPEGDNEYTYSALSFYTFEPYPGYRLADVLVDGVSVGPVPYYYFVDTLSTHTLEAVFTPATTYSGPALLDSSSVNYSGIQGAYDMANSQDTIKIKAGAGLADGVNIHVDRDVDVKLQGGYDEYFDSVIAETEYFGTLIVAAGSINVSSLIIK